MKRKKKTKRPGKPKRNRFLVFWDRKWSAWVIRYPDTGESICPAATKAAVVREAAEYARQEAPSQLVVKTKAGRFSFERTYQADPRRSPG